MNDWLDNVSGRLGATNELSSRIPALLEPIVHRTSGFLSIFQVREGRHHLDKDLDSFQLGCFFGSGGKGFIEGFVLDAVQKVGIRSLERKRRNTVVVDDVIHILAHERVKGLGKGRKNRGHGGCLVGVDHRSAAALASVGLEEFGFVRRAKVPVSSEFERVNSKEVKENNILLPCSARDIGVKRSQVGVLFWKISLSLL